MDNMKRKLLATFSVVYSAIAAQSAHAVAPASLAQVPLFLVNSAEPQVMLNMSNDHQLFYKAYDDWSDVDGDGVIDITYDHGITYYGYFDSFVCYDYDGVADVGKARATHPAVLERGMAEAIIGRALLRILQAIVSLTDRLEPCFGIGASGIAVRMALHRRLAEGRFQLDLRDGALNAQDFVEVALRHFTATG